MQVGGLLAPGVVPRRVQLWAEEEGFRAEGFLLPCRPSPFLIPTIFSLFCSSLRVCLASGALTRSGWSGQSERYLTYTLQDNPTPDDNLDSTRREQPQP